MLYSDVTKHARHGTPPLQVSIVHYSTSSYSLVQPSTVVPVVLSNKGSSYEKSDLNGLGSRACSCTRLKFFVYVTHSFTNGDRPRRKVDGTLSTVEYRVQLKHSRALLMWYVPQRAF